MQGGCLHHVQRMAAYLGGEDWEHGVARSNCLAIPPEGQVGSGQYDAGVSYTASHIGASLGCHIQCHHSTIHYDMVSHLISNDNMKRWETLSNL